MEQPDTGQSGLPAQPPSEEPVEAPTEKPAKEPTSPAALNDEMVKLLFHSLSGHNVEIQDAIPLSDSFNFNLQELAHSEAAASPLALSTATTTSSAPAPTSSSAVPPSSPTPGIPETQFAAPPPPASPTAPPPPASPAVPPPATSAVPSPAWTAGTRSPQPSSAAALSAGALSNHSTLSLPAVAPPISTTIVIKKPGSKSSGLSAPQNTTKRGTHQRALHVQTLVTSNSPLVNSPFLDKAHPSENIRNLLEKMASGTIPGFQNMGGLSIILKHVKAIRSGQFLKVQNSFPLLNAQSPLDVLLHQYVLLNLSHVVKQTSEIESLETQLSFSQKRTLSLQSALDTPSQFEQSFKDISNTLQRHKTFHLEVVASLENDATNLELRHASEISRLSTQIKDLHLQVKQVREHADKQSQKLKDAREQLASQAREQSITHSELQEVGNAKRLLDISLQEKEDEIVALRLDSTSFPNATDFQTLKVQFEKHALTHVELQEKHRRMKKVFSKLCKRTELALNEEEQLLLKYSEGTPPRSRSGSRSRSSSSSSALSRTSSGPEKPSGSPSARKSRSKTLSTKAASQQSVNSPSPSDDKSSFVTVASLTNLPSTSTDFPALSSKPAYAKTVTKTPPVLKPEEVEDDSLQMDVTDTDRLDFEWKTVGAKQKRKKEQSQDSSSPTASPAPTAARLPLLKVDLPRVRSMTQGLYTRTFETLKRLVSKIGGSLLSDQALINALRKPSITETEAHHTVNNFCKGLSQCRTVNSITSFLNHPSIKEREPFQIWPDFRDNSVEWNFVKAAEGTNHFVDFDRLICLFRCYNTQLYEFFKFAKSRSPEEQSKCFKLLYNRDFDFHHGRKSIWEKKMDILILLICSRISFYVEDDMPDYDHNAEFAYHCLSTPFTLQWKEEMFQVRGADPYLHSDETFHFLFIEDPPARNALHEWSKVTTSSRNPPHKKAKANFLNM